MDERLKRLRAADRLSAPTIIKTLMTTFVQQQGDRVLGRDAALTAGFGRASDGQRLAVLGVDRGTDLTSRRAKNGGALTVAGYRTVARVLRHAEKFQLPVVSLINMPGADASPMSERFGQSQAIADVIALTGQLTVPNLVVFLGEGHSGGALGFANANRIMMLDDALFNVASPDAVAAILHGQQTVSDAIDLLPMTAEELQRRHLVDQVLDHQRPDLVAAISDWCLTTSATLRQCSAVDLVQQREQKFQDFLAQWPLN